MYRANREEAGSLILLVSLAGSDFQCNNHIIPVKNEEGVVMMFILNFEYVVDEESDNSTEKISQTSPTKSDQSEYLKGSSRLAIRILKSNGLNLCSPHTPVFLHILARAPSPSEWMCFILYTLPSKALVKK